MALASAALAVLFYADTSRAQSCDKIVEQGFYNIMISKSAKASISTKYFNNCGIIRDDMSDDTLGKAELEIFGVGGGSGSLSKSQRVQKLNSWCTENRETAESNKNLYEETRTLYSDAINAWDHCNYLSRLGVVMDPRITPDKSTVDIRLHYNGPSHVGPVFYRAQARGFNCDTWVPSADGKPVRYDGKDFVAMSNEAIYVSCRRDEPRKVTVDSQSYYYVPVGIIEVLTAADNVQLFFGEEWRPPAPAQKVIELENSLADIRGRLANKAEMEFVRKAISEQPLPKLQCTIGQGLSGREATCAPGWTAVYCFSGANLSSMNPGSLQRNKCENNSEINWTVAWCCRISRD
jgi:hypothetical protein